MNSGDLCCDVSDECCEEGGEAGGRCMQSKYRMRLLRRWREHVQYIPKTSGTCIYMARPVQDPRMKTSDCHPGGQVSDFDDGQMYIL